MTPLQIQMMLHYYSRVEPYAKNEQCHANSRAVFEQRGALLKLDLLYSSSEVESGYSLTDRGVAYIAALQAVKPPVSKTIWVQPND